MNSPHLLSLTGDLTVRNIGEVQPAIVEALTLHTSVEVDCGAATEADLSFIQLLIAAAKSAARSGKSLALVGPAEGALRRALLRGGFIDGAGNGDPAGRAFWQNGTGAR